MTAIRSVIQPAIRAAIQSVYGAGAVAWTPLPLFANSEVGVWYDPSDFSTMYQDSAGTTPVTAVGNPVGLVLDKSKGLVSSSKRGYLVGAEKPFSTPSAAALDITGDIDLRAYINPKTWTDARVINKDNLGASRNYGLTIKADKKIVLEYGAGGTYYTNNSSAAYSGADNVPIWVRATLDVDNGAGGRTARFYTSTDGSTWAELGTPAVTAGTVALDTGTAVLEVGGNDVRNVNLNGAVIRAQVLSGIGGTVVADFNPTLYTGGSTFTASTGETWTVNAGCFIAPEGNHAYQATAASRLTSATGGAVDFDGTDDSVAQSGGGGSTTGFMLVAAIKPEGGAGTVRNIWSDTGTNTGYVVRINASNQLEMAVGNGSAYTTVATTATLDVGTAYVVSAWDDGTNLNVQINSGTVASATRPTVSAGSSTATIGKSNTSAASYFNGLMYQVLQTKNDGGTDAERTEAKAYCATKGGVTL